MKKNIFLIHTKRLLCVGMSLFMFSSQCLFANTACFTIQNDTEGHFSSLSGQGLCDGDDMSCTINADNESHQWLEVCSDDASNHSVDLHYQVDHLGGGVASQPAVLHVSSQPGDEGVQFTMTMGSDTQLYLASDYKVSSNNGVYDAQKGPAYPVVVNSASPQKLAIVYPGQLPTDSHPCDANGISLDNITGQDLTVSGDDETDSVATGILAAGASECIYDLPPNLMLVNDGKSEGNIGTNLEFSDSTIDEPTVNLGDWSFDYPYTYKTCSAIAMKTNHNYYKASSGFQLTIPTSSEDGFLPDEVALTCTQLIPDTMT